MAGVAAGLARYLGVNVTIIRVPSRSLPSGTSRRRRHHWETSAFSAERAPPRLQTERYDAQARANGLGHEILRRAEVIARRVLTPSQCTATFRLSDAIMIRESGRYSPESGCGQPRRVCQYHRRHALADS
jgi:hypothetical protein